MAPHYLPDIHIWKKKKKNTTQKIKKIIKYKDLLQNT